MYSDYNDDALITILSNVNLGKYATKEGLNRYIEEGGSNLSGGEKKRLCIARALLRDTPVLIFDEPLANLDNDNVSLIEDILLSIKNKTIIIVSHQFTEAKRKSIDAVLNIGTA
jgi:ATP-binding cassette, subfamily B, bacterial